jgi:hypothetical protein
MMTAESGAPAGKEGSLIILATSKNGDAGRF